VGDENIVGVKREFRGIHLQHHGQNSLCASRNILPVKEGKRMFDF
jgi:hypothetical protein